MPIELLQSTLNFSTKFFQPTDDQLEIGLGLRLRAQPAGLFFQGLQAFFETPDTGLGLGFVEITFRVTINQPRNPLAYLGNALLDLRDLGLSRRHLNGIETALIFRRDPLGVGQELADGLPDRRFQPICPDLGIMTDPLAPKPIGITANTAIIGIRASMTRAGTGTDRFTVIGIAAAGTHPQPLEQILSAALTLAGPAAVFLELLLDGVKERLLDQCRHGYG